MSGYCIWRAGLRLQRTSVIRSGDANWAGRQARSSSVGSWHRLTLTRHDIAAVRMGFGSHRSHVSRGRKGNCFTAQSPKPRNRQKRESGFRFAFTENGQPRARGGLDGHCLSPWPPRNTRRPGYRLASCSPALPASFSPGKKTLHRIETLSKSPTAGGDTKRQCRPDGSLSYATRCCRWPITQAYAFFARLCE